MTGWTLFKLPRSQQSEGVLKTSRLVAGRLGVRLSFFFFPGKVQFVSGKMTLEIFLSGCCCCCFAFFVGLGGEGEDVETCGKLVGSFRFLTHDTAFPKTAQRHQVSSELKYQNYYSSQVVLECESHFGM